MLKFKKIRMTSVLKKIIVGSLIVFLIGILTTICLLVINKEKLILLFNSEIIDKASIRVDFASIDFSVFQNFPNGSIILSKATIYYPEKNQIDTLLYSNSLSFRFNIINALRGFYDFSSIGIEDGLINLNYDKLDVFLSKNSADPKSKQIFSAKKVAIKNCRFRYSYGKNLRIRLVVNKSILSGILFNNDNFKFGLTADASNFQYKYSKIRYNNQTAFHISTTIHGNQEGFYTEEGLFKIAALPANFNVKYIYHNEMVWLNLSTTKLNLRKSLSVLSGKDIRELSNGDISLIARYNGCLENLDKQVLSVTYTLNNVVYKSKEQEYCLSKLNGKTVFTGEFENNTTDVNNFSYSQTGLSINGTGKIKNFPKPYVLIDAKVQSTDISSFSKINSVLGSVSGNIKTLLKIKDIDSLNFSNVEIKNILSSLKYSNLTFINSELLKNIDGEIKIDDNDLNVTALGSLSGSNFQATLILNNFLDVINLNKPICPTLNIKIDSLDVDKIPLGNNKKEMDYACFRVIGQINKLYYRGDILKNVRFKLHSDEKIIAIDTFSLSAFSGYIAGSIPVFEKNHKQGSFYFHKIDINNVFKTFNNFGQTTITHQNISGSLSGKITMSYSGASITQIDKKSIIVDSKLVLENGVFNDVKQFKKVSSFLKLSEMESIKFGTITNNIKIQNGIISIPAMNISSNALNVQLSGEHNLEGEYTYWLKINLKEILARRFVSKNDNKTEYEADNNSGLNLYIKISGDSTSYKVNYDKKNATKHLKGNLTSEGLLLKSILKAEFSSLKTDTSFNSTKTDVNKIDSSNNKIKKNAFKIEWEELDTTKHL